MWRYIANDFAFLNLFRIRNLIDDDEYGIVVDFTDDTDEEETTE